MPTNEEIIESVLGNVSAATSGVTGPGGPLNITLPNLSELPQFLDENGELSIYYTRPVEPYVSKAERAEKYDRFARRRGLATSEELEGSTSTIEAMLRQAGVDVEHPNVQAAIQGFGDMLQDPTLGPAMIANLAETYPAAPLQDYDRALAVSGFRGPYVAPQPAPGFGQLAAQEGVDVADLKPPTPNFETQPETGWIRYKNGVLVSPEGDVMFDPTSRAPGSIAWGRDVVSNWSDQKVAEWRKRLHDFGYLTKDQAKVKGVDSVFLSALSSYHISRYANGGKPVAGDLAGVSTPDEKGPLLNYEDVSAQIRNDVREQYRRVFGTDATDGLVEGYTNTIIRTAMELQRRYRKKEYSGYSSMAATEAEERFIERLEGSPQATFLRESTEENTSLRDALQQAVIVTQSLGG
jgi:hypothetical protein